MFKYISALLLFLTLITSSTVSADEVIIENGNKITGTVQRMEGDSLTITTDYSDPIMIKRSKIISIHIDSPADIHMSNGEILKGTVSSDKEGNAIVGPAPGRTASVVTWENIAAINPVPPAPSKWSGSVVIGAGLQSGNTDRASATVGAESSRRTLDDRYSLRFLYNYAEESNNLTARNTYGAGKYDYFFTKKTYGYLGVELLNDEFKDLKLRTVVGPGIGYQFWEDAVKFLLLEAGISYFSEDREAAEDADWIAARLSGHVKYRIKDALTVSDYLIIYPSLEDIGEYTLRNEASLTSPLIYGWSLQLSNILEQNSSPPPTISKTDSQWILGLRYDF